MARQIEKCCETCREWFPIGGCSFGRNTLCDEWKISLSYPVDNEPTLW